MIKRIKQGKVFDIIKFNQNKETFSDESDDIFAKKQSVQKVKIFGLEQQMAQIYQYKNYNMTQFLSKTVGDILIKQFISGYYGITEDSIINYKDIGEDSDVNVQFEISESAQLLSMVERQQRLGNYKQLSEQIKQYAPIFKVFKLKTKSITTYFTNTVNENQYVDIFNQLYIGSYQITQNNYKIKTDNDLPTEFYVVCVKYNNNYKGKIYYPIKYYHDLPILENNSLLIQIIDSNQLITYMFRQEKLIVHQQLIIQDIPNPFKFINTKPLKQLIQYQIQLDFVNQTQKQITKKMDQLVFVPQWRKTHGNQFIITGIKHNSQYDPKLKITFFPSTNYVQIQCETDKLETALLNFTMLMNYFQLEDPYPELYDENKQIKTQSIKQYLQLKNDINQDNQRNHINLKNIGTEQFDIKQQFFKIQDSQLDELQLVDPISFGIDDRYEYQKLVTDVLKRPIQIWAHTKIIPVQDGIKQNNIIIQDDIKQNNTQSGGAKGSPVYINKSYDYSQFLLWQQSFIVNGFVLKNQTFIDTFNRYKCSQNYPYLLLGNTKGKDSISCVIDPINPLGLSVFEFYDVANRLLVFDKYEINKKQFDYLSYLREMLYGRVSISATKFSQWITPGRCSELPLNLKKILGSGTLLLSVLQLQSQSSDTQYNINTQIDMKWLESVLGKPYDEIYDGDVIYDYQDNLFYTTNVNGKNQSIWVKFPNHKKYLVIYDEIITINNKNKKYHYYKPYFNQFKLSRQKRQFDINFYEKFGILGYINFQYKNYNYIVTKKGTFPLIDSPNKLKLLKQQITDNLPSYETVKNMINDTDNYIINYKGNKIGTKYGDLLFYWKEINFKTEQQLTIGTYLINTTQWSDQKWLGTVYDYKIVAYCIYQYILLQKYFINSKYILEGNTQIELLKDALQHENKVIEIFKSLGRYNNQFDYFYLNTQILILSQLNEEQIKQGIVKLKQLIPKTDQLMLDYVKGLARFSNNKELQYDPIRREEILRLSIKKDFDFQ